MNGMSNRGAYSIWCQKVLPLVYEESLSYYELLCKVVNYLSDTIKHVDEHDEAIDALNNNFNELKNFVEHYFDELGVAAEIDKKLDEMAANGTLERLFKVWVGDDLSSVREDLGEDIAEVKDKVVALEGVVDAITQEGIGDSVYAEVLVDETGFVFNSVRERLQSKHNGVTIVKRPMTLVGESYRTGRIRKGNVDITIKGQFPKSIRVYADATTSEYTSLGSDIVSPYIIKGYDGQYFECLNRVEPTGEVELVYGRTTIKHQPVTGTPTLNILPGGNTNWGARNIQSTCACMSVPISTRGFKEMVVDYDYSAVIIKNAETTELDPPAPEYAYQICGYNRITKDMLPDGDMCLIGIVPADIGRASATRYDDVKSGGLLNPMQNCYSINCDYTKVNNGVNYHVENNLNAIQNVGMTIKQNYHPRYTNNRTPASKDFHGVFYGGTPYSGSFGVNFPSSVYYAALLNPYSCAYSNVDKSVSGYEEYGLSCSRLMALLFGYREPWTTGNMNLAVKGVPANGRMGNIFSTSGRYLYTNLGDIIGNIERDDIIMLTEYQDYTGHCMMARDVYVSDGKTYINVVESANPYTQDNVIVCADDIVYDNHDPASSYLFNTFGLLKHSTTANYFGKELDDGVIAPPPYVVPKPVMCNRGYGGLYVKYNGNEGLKVIVTIEDGIDNLILSNLDTGMSANVLKSSLVEVEHRDVATSGYKPYDISDLVAGMGVGLFSISANGHAERFYVRDISNVSVEATQTTATSAVTVVNNGDGYEPVAVLGRYNWYEGQTYTGGNWVAYYPGNNLPYGLSGGVNNEVLVVEADKTITLFLDTESNCTFWCCADGAKGV